MGFDLEEFDDLTAVENLVSESTHCKLRMEWLTRCKVGDGLDYRGGMVFSHYGTTIILNYVLDQLKRQARDAGVFIDELMIGPDNGFPKGAITFERQDYMFVNKTPDTGKCIEIF